MVSMSTLIQALISGICFGLIYGLIGIEYTLIYNATGIINFAHDKVINFGGYMFAALFLNKLGCSLIVSLLGAFVCAAILAALMSLGIFAPLRDKSRICTLLATVMAADIISEGIRLAFGPYGIPVESYFPGTFTILGAVLPKTYVYVIAGALVLTVALQLFLNVSKPGKAMKCVNQNPVAAGLMGINVKKYIILASILSFCVCTFIGFLVIPIMTLSMTMAGSVALKGFAAGIIGGFGFLPGAVVGGVVLGVVENIVCLFISSGYKDVVSFVFLVLFLLLKPDGILGRGSSAKMV